MHSVLVVVGSAHANSINLQFTHALEKLAAGKLRFDYADLKSLPYYDNALWDNPPDSVVRLKQQITSADAVLLATPEFNRSIPGILKNGLDWASRPFGKSAWKGKPAAIVGATTGQIGTAAAQVHLRSLAVTLGLVVMGQPEVYFQLKPGLIADDATVTDATTVAFLSGWIDTFTAFIDRHGDKPAIQVAAE